MVRGVRAFFDARGFVEVETPVRIAAPAPEEHIDCPPVAGGGYLRASPELQMKKLLAAGMERIYQIGPCFREGERGSRHNPEFTMIEWYRRGADYSAIRTDLCELLAALTPRGAKPTPILDLTVKDAYARYAGWDPWTDWDKDRFDIDMATKIEPAIAALGGGVFLADYPPQAASLAKMRGDVAERWEFYLDGIELANCFSELCDGAEQRRRFEKARQERKALGESDYPIDDEFLGSIDAIGSAAGVALGIDRLFMALLGVSEIVSVRVTD